MSNISQLSMHTSGRTFRFAFLLVLSHKHLVSYHKGNRLIKITNNIEFGVAERRCPSVHSGVGLATQSPSGTRSLDVCIYRCGARAAVVRNVYLMAL